MRSGQTDRRFLADAEQEGQSEAEARSNVPGVGELDQASERGVEEEGGGRIEEKRRSNEVGKDVHAPPAGRRFQVIRSDGQQSTGADVGACARIALVPAANESKHVRAESSVAKLMAERRRQRKQPVVVNVDGRELGTGPAVADTELAAAIIIA